MRLIVRIPETEEHLLTALHPTHVADNSRGAEQYLDMLFTMEDLAV